MEGTQPAALITAIDSAPLIVWKITRKDQPPGGPMQAFDPTNFQPSVLAGAALYPTFLAEAPQVIKDAIRAFAGERCSATVHTPNRTYCTHYSPLYEGPCLIAVSAVTTVAPSINRPVQTCELADEPLFRQLVDSLPQIVWTARPNGKISYYNARWYSYTGLSPAMGSNAPWQLVLHPDDLQICQQAWASGVKSGRAYQMECRLKNGTTGHFKWFLTQVTPAYDAAGCVTTWFGSSTDVDKHKQDGQQLQEIFESMHEAFFSVDKNWKILRVNREQEIQTEMPRKAQIGKNFLNLFFSTEESQKTLYWSQYHKAMQQRIAVTFEDYYEPLKLWTAVNVYPSSDGGMAVFFRNISSERRLRQAIEVEKQKFEAVFVDAPAAMALLRGPTFIFEKVNPTYKTLMGGRDLLNKSLHDALPELHNQKFFNLMTEVFTTGVPYIGHNTLARLIRRAGGTLEDCYLDFTYSRITDDKGNPYGIYIHAIDVTDNYLSKIKTENLMKSLQDTITARDDFLSSASHELKTPVTSLKMRLQMIRRHVKPEQGLAPPPAKLAQTLDVSCRQIDRLTALIDDMLDVSRIESGKMTFNFEPVNISALIMETVEQFKDQFMAAKCTVDAVFTDNIIATCDCFRIEQVITNLITNAIKYGTGSLIRIRAEPTDTAGVRITVADAGMGIAKDKQSLVFGRFERAISHNNISGLGLGLYICKQIVEAHGGDISLESVLGKGSTFTVSLPANPVVSVTKTAATQNDASS